MTDPRPRILEPGDFDLANFKAPIFEGLSIEQNRAFSIAQKMRMMGIAWQQARHAHREWFLERNPDGTPVDVWGDWHRVTGCSVILAKAIRDAAESEADTPIIVETASCETV